MDATTDESDADFSESTTVKRIKFLKKRINNAPAKKAIVSKKISSKKNEKNTTKSRKKVVSPSNTSSKSNISQQNNTVRKTRKRKINSEDSVSRSNSSPIISKNKKPRYNVEEPNNNFTSPNNIQILRSNISPENSPISKNKKRKRAENNFTPPNNIEIENNTPSKNKITPPNQVIRPNYITISPLESSPRNSTTRHNNTPSICESMTLDSPSSPENTDKRTTRKRNQRDERDSNIPPNSVLIKQMDPQHRDRLFYKIVKAKIMELVVQQWFDCYKIDHEKGLREIYQLFIDLASFQHIDINEYLDNELNEIDNIVKHMISIENLVVMATQKYFLYFRGTTYMKKRERIEKFIEIFVDTCAREKIIYDFHLFKKIIHFIVIFCNNDKRCIRHTGVYLGLKFQTGLVNIEALITRKVYKYQKTLENESDPSEFDRIKSKIEKLKIYDEKINAMIIYLQLNVFTKNWNLMDIKIWKMRLECLEELYKWIEIFPGRHLQSENISYLVKAMLKDVSPEVRYKAIEIIGKLIENYSGILGKQIPKLIENIAQKIRDVNIKTAAFAVYTLSKIRKVANIPANVREILCKYIFSPKYPVAAASGKYLADVIKEKNKDDNEDGLAVLLLNFEKKCNQREIFQHQYLIDSLYDHLPIFTNISPFITIYKNYDLDDELTTIWMNVVTEIMHITFFGKSSAKRSIQNRTPKDVNVAIADRMYIVMWRFLKEIDQSGSDVKKFLPIFCAMKGYKNVHPDISRLLQDLSRVQIEENYKIEPIDSEINVNNTNAEEDIVVKMEIE